jgi:hypothetical protein
MKKAFKTLIVLSLLFLSSTMIVRGQNISGTTNRIEISKSLADTIIHDLEHRKLLIKKVSILESNILILRDENSYLHQSIDEREIEIIKLRERVKNRGLQRNLLLLGVIVGGVLIFTK